MGYFWHLKNVLFLGRGGGLRKCMICTLMKMLTIIASPLNKFESNGCESIVTGDFNIDLLKINDKRVISDYFDMLSSHSFCLKITIPTNNNGTLIGNFECKLTECHI